MVIDLGVPRDDYEPPPRPWSPRPRRAVAALAAFASLLSVGGAAPERSPLTSVVIQATAADDVALQGDAIFLLRPSRGTIRAGLRTITRYSLPDAGTPDWEARIYTVGPLRGASLVDGMLLAIAHGEKLETIAIRPETGQEVWRRPGGWYRSTAPGHVLMEDHGDVLVQRLLNVDLDTGDVRWSRRYSGNDLVFVDGDRYVHWARSGMARVYDADSGALLAARELPFDEQPAMYPAGDLLIVPGEAYGRPVVTAYGRDRLDRRWQADIDLQVEFVNGDCHDALCVGSINDDGVRVVDIDSGRTRWSAPGWGYVHEAGPYLLAYGRGESAVPRTAFLDPADGRVVAELGEWSASEPGPDGRMLAIREENLRAMVALIDPYLPGARVLGVLDDVFQCQASATVVVCRRSGGSIGVWYPERRLYP